MELAEVAPLSSFSRVTVLTGAGVSAASNLPTFRGPGGLWEDADLERAMHTRYLPASLPLVWRVWGEVGHAAALAGPNPSHTALAQAEALLSESGGRLTLLTQNVDGLHQAAGSTEVVELHGSSRRARCLRGSCAYVQEIQDLDLADLPQCPTHSCLLRPDLVLFGESLPSRAVLQAERACRDAELFLSVGTSGEVWPASELVSVASASGALCVSLTLEPMPHPHPDFDHVLLGRSEAELPRWASS